MLHDGHELDVRVAHLADVGDELVGEIVIAVVGSALSRELISGTRPSAILAGFSLRLVSVPPPAAQMYLGRC